MFGLKKLSEFLTVKNKKLPGSIIYTNNGLLSNKLFYVNGGKRRYIRNNKFLKDNGFDWVRDVEKVESGVIEALINRGPVPIYRICDLKRIQPTFNDLRDIVAERLNGTGVEFGAGSSPFPTPLDCNVLFADAFSYDSLISVMYPGQNIFDLVRPDYVTDIKTFAGIDDSSLDFVIACHVIEHTNNPIQAIRSCYKALKPGGLLVLVIPDIYKTFDKHRDLTTLEHLIEDYENPSEARDFGHYLEFYEKAFYDHLPKGADLKKFAAEKMLEGGDIHYHTWTYESFGRMVAYCCHEFGFRLEFSHETLTGPDNIEFYYVLRKQDEAD